MPVSAAIAVQEPVQHVAVRALLPVDGCRIAECLVAGAMGVDAAGAMGVGDLKNTTVDWVVAPAERVAAGKAVKAGQLRGGNARETTRLSDSQSSARDRQTNKSKQKEQRD